MVSGKFDLARLAEFHVRRHGVNVNALIQNAIIIWQNFGWGKDGSAFEFTLSCDHILNFKRRCIEKGTAVLDASNTGSSLPQGPESAIKTNHFALSSGRGLGGFVNAFCPKLLFHKTEPP